MSKYIDAEKLEKNGWNIHRIRQASSTEMVYEVKKPTDFPAADVVEVVRCKDCKYRKNEQPSMVYCPHMIGGWVDEKWIPCSERLPEEDYETGNGVQFSADVLATIVNHKNDGELYVWLLKTVDGKWYDYIPNEDGSQEVPYWCEVIAWMPLPEPYSGADMREVKE